MAKKLSEKSLASFKSKLSGDTTPRKAPLNLKQFVKGAYLEIKQARKLNISWEEIAKHLEESSDDAVTVSPKSLEQYYKELVSRRNQLKAEAKAKKQNSPPNSEETDSKKGKPASAIEVKQEEKPPQAASAEGTTFQETKLKQEKGLTSADESQPASDRVATHSDDSSELEKLLNESSSQALESNKTVKKSRFNNIPVRSSP